MTLTPNPAWRGDPTFLPQVLKLFGVNYRELPGWDKWGIIFPVPYRPRWPANSPQSRHRR